MEEADPLRLALQQLASTMGVSLPTAMAAPAVDAVENISSCSTDNDNTKENNKIETDVAEHEEGELSEVDDGPPPLGEEVKGARRKRASKTSPNKRKKMAKGHPLAEPKSNAPQAAVSPPLAALNSAVVQSALAAKRERPRVPCRYWMEGKCSKGDECTFSHAQRPLRSPEEARSEEACRFHIAGTCLKGEACLYSHDLSRVPCKFFHVKASCAAGGECRFSHAPISEQVRHQLFAEMMGSKDPRLANSSEAIPTASKESPVAGLPVSFSTRTPSSNRSAVDGRAAGAAPSPPLPAIPIDPNVFLDPEVAKYNPFGSPFL